MRSLAHFSVVTLSSALMLLTGCGLGTPAVPDSVASPALMGRAIGGQQPVVGATVTAYEVGSSGYGAGATAKASVLSDANGNYAFPANAYTCTASNSPMYLVATGGNPGGGTNVNSALIAAVGPCAAGRSSFIIINEVTTAATVLALGRFMGTTLGSSGNAYNIGGTCSGCATGTYNRGLVQAMNNTYPQLVDNARGAAIASHTAGTLTITTESAKVNTIANVIAACVNSTGTTSTTETTTTCGKLFTGVNATGASTRASDTLQAALEMELYPYYNVSTTFALGSATSPFLGLSTAPNDWTVALGYTTTTLGLAIQQGTTSNLDIDASGTVYIPSNKTGANGLGVFDPTSATFKGPFLKTLVANPQYVAIDQSSTPIVYITDQSSSVVAGLSTVSLGGPVSYSTSNYTTGGPISVDAANNILLAANTGSTHTLYAIPPTRTTQTQAAGTGPAAGFTFTPSGTPNGVQAAQSVPYTNGYLFVGDTSSACNLEFSPGTVVSASASTGTSTCVIGGVLATNLGYYTGYSTTSTNSICYEDEFLSVQGCTSPGTLNVPEGIAADGSSRFWVANSAAGLAAGASVSAFTVSSNCYYTNCNATAVGGSAAVQYLHGTNNGGTATAPYGIGVDGSGNVWVSNASCISTSSTTCSATSFTLTEIVGAATPTITPISAQASSGFGSRPSN